MGRDGKGTVNPAWDKRGWKFCSSSQPAGTDENRQVFSSSGQLDFRSCSLSWNSGFLWFVRTGFFCWTKVYLSAGLECYGLLCYMLFVSHCVFILLALHDGGIKVRALTETPLVPTKHRRMRSHITLCQYVKVPCLGGRCLLDFCLPKDNVVFFIRWSVSTLSADFSCFHHFICLVINFRSGDLFFRRALGREIWSLNFQPKLILNSLFFISKSYFIPSLSTKGSRLICLLNVRIKLEIPEYASFPTRLHEGSWKKLNCA